MPSQQFNSLAYFTVSLKNKQTKKIEVRFISAILDVVISTRHLTSTAPSSDSFLPSSLDLPFLLEFSCTTIAFSVCFEVRSQPIPQPKWRIKEMFILLWATSLPPCLHMWVSNWSARHIKCQAKTVVQQMPGTRLVIALKKEGTLH